MKMGGKSTKEINGDAEMNIINNLESHKTTQDKHEIILLIILIMVSILLLLKLVEVYKIHIKNNNLKTAKIVKTLQTV